MSNIQILAPAGSAESVIAAVRCGANAVYLGGSSFNARRNAQNFTEETLAEIVTYCHIHGVKVYFTLNTVVFDDEFGALNAEIHAAANAGVDAFIIQDMGVLSAVQTICPTVPLFASTQMSIHNASGVRFAKAAGFSRAVLARELSMQEIKNIAANTDLELEVFVHGALCMCVSGQCYLSAMIGQRSGNRGLCAQPCRLPFSTTPNGNGYALSLKDLSLIKQIGALKEIGVTSLKIEGRMKRPEYVAAAVTACKMAIEGKQPDLQTLEAIFSRSGFTDGYFTARRDKTMFGTRQKEDVLAAKTVLTQLKNSYKEERQVIPVRFSITIAKNQKTILSCTDGAGHVVQAEGSPPEIAQVRDLSDEVIEKSLRKTGQTPYLVTDIAIQKQPGLTLKMSALNEMRRRALSLLDQARSVPPQPVSAMFSIPSAPPVQRGNAIRVRLASSRQLSPLLIQQAAQIALPMAELKKALQKNLSPAEKLTVDLPRVSFDEEQLKRQLQQLQRQGVTKAIAHTCGDIQILKELGFTISGSFTLNITNSASVAWYQQQGLHDCELSFETDMASAKQIRSAIPIGIVAYGALPLMVFRNCPQKAQSGCAACKQNGVLYDRKKTAFPLECGGDYAQLLNSLPLNLSDKAADLAHFSFRSLYFTKETAEQCASIFTLFQKKESQKGNYTHGLYYRKVL